MQHIPSHASNLKPLRSTVIWSRSGQEQPSAQSGPNFAPSQPDFSYGQQQHISPVHQPLPGHPQSLNQAQFSRRSPPHFRPLPDPQYLASGHHIFALPNHQHITQFNQAHIPPSNHQHIPASSQTNVPLFEQSPERPPARFLEINRRVTISTSTTDAVRTHKNMQIKSSPANDVASSVQNAFKH